MDRIQLLKHLEKEAHQMRRKIDKVQDPRKKQKLMRKYEELNNILDF